MRSHVRTLAGNKRPSVWLSHSNCVGTLYEMQPGQSPRVEPDRLGRFFWMASWMVKLASLHERSRNWKKLRNPHGTGSRVWLVQLGGEA